MLECQCHHRTGKTDGGGKRQEETYPITGHKPRLMTSHNDYKRGLFSFQQSCMNQTVTKSIGIHLKWKMRMVKKNKQISFQVRRMPSIVRWGEKKANR